eukprot:TRINITY_DN40251_c0_g1_i1.p1 TRINITY_DN40251_c0_g1~~TRINITY_DN40251_c0_g1_i1.p1  ORF type:complete len:848 (+),score=124.72 TRINITY_DN40251_c0_g1_i1:84-2627(+)
MNAAYGTVAPRSPAYTITSPGAAYSYIHASPHKSSDYDNDDDDEEDRVWCERSDNEHTPLETAAAKAVSACKLLAESAVADADFVACEHSNGVGESESFLTSLQRDALEVDAGVLFVGSSPRHEKSIDEDATGDNENFCKFLSSVLASAETELLDEHIRLVGRREKALRKEIESLRVDVQMRRQPNGLQSSPALADAGLAMGSQTNFQKTTSPSQTASKPRLKQTSFSIDSSADPLSSIEVVIDTLPRPPGSSVDGNGNSRSCTDASGQRCDLKEGCHDPADSDSGGIVKLTNDENNVLSISSSENSGASEAITSINSGVHHAPGIALKSQIMLKSKSRSIVFDDENRPKYLRSERAKQLSLSTMGTRIDSASRSARESMKSSLHVGGPVEDLLRAAARNSAYQEDVSFDSCQCLRGRNGIQRRLTLINTFMSVVILLNCAEIGMSYDLNGWRGWVVVDAVFACMYVVEFLSKIGTIGYSNFFCGPDRWMLISDLMFCILAVMESLYLFSRGEFKGVPSNEVIDANPLFFRIVKIARISRVLRVFRLRLFRDLVMMVNGSVGGIRTLFSSLVLISFPLYMVAILFREMLGDELLGAEYFPSVAQSFFQMFLCVVAGECVDANGKSIPLRLTAVYGWGYGFIYCALLSFMTMGLFNVIASIYVENVVSAATFADKVAKRSRLRDKDYFALKIAAIVELFWVHQSEADANKSDDGPSDRRRGLSQGKGSDYFSSAANVDITPEVFCELRNDERFGNLLADLDVSDEDQFNLFQTLDSDKSGIVDMKELVAGIAKLRGEARRSDIVEVNFLVRTIQETLNSFACEVIEMQTRQTEVLIELQEQVQLNSPE